MSKRKQLSLVEFVKKYFPHLPLTVEQISTFEEAMKLLSGGLGVSICSDKGFGKVSVYGGKAPLTTATGGDEGSLLGVPLTEFMVSSRAFGAAASATWPEEKVDEESAKLLAQILLSDCPSHKKRIVVPSKEEWIGVNLLERDDKLKRRDHDNGNKRTSTPTNRIGSSSNIPSATSDSGD